MPVQPYLFFEGRCEEAINFYRKALGAEVSMLMRFKDAPPMPAGTDEAAGCGGAMPPGDKVMHAAFRIGDTELLASDGQCNGARASFTGFSLTLSVPDVAAADRAFAALSDGGTVQMPLTATFFSPRWGMVADRFGISWMILVPMPG